MKVDIEKVITLAKKNYDLNISQLCKVCKISTSTFWRWRKGITEPKNKDIINIAKVLNVDPHEFTEIAEEKEKSISPNNLPSLNNVSDYLKRYNEKFRKAMQDLKCLNTSTENIIALMTGILDNTNIAFYVKDVQLRYTIANAAFLNNLKLKKTYNVYGKTDSDLLPLKEAQVNSAEDELVFITQKPILAKERYIPGTSKKRWGFISKMPIFNSDGKEVGIIAVLIDITQKVKEDVINTLLKIALKNIDYSIMFREIGSKKCLFFSDPFNRQADDFPDEYFKFSLKERVAKRVFSSDRDFYYKKLNDFYCERVNEVDLTFREYIDVNKSIGFRWINLYVKKILFLEKKYHIRIRKDITSEMEEKNKLMVASHVINNLKYSAVFLFKIPKFRCNKVLFLLVSSQIEQISGYKPEYFLRNGDSILSLIDMENREAIESCLYLYREGSYSYEFTINCRSTEKKLCLINITYFKVNDVSYGSIIFTVPQNGKKLHDKSGGQYEDKIKDIALKLKNNNVDIHIIAESTGLPVKEIEKL